MSRKGGNPNLANEGKKYQFSSINQPDGKQGRRPSKIRAFISKNDLSKDDITDSILALSEMSRKELEDLVKNPDTPVLLVGFAAAFMGDIHTRKGSLAGIESMITRALGKPVETIRQEIDLNTTVAQMSRSEKEERLKELLAIASKKPTS